LLGKCSRHVAAEFGERTRLGVLIAAPCRNVLQEEKVRDGGAPSVRAGVANTHGARELPERIRNRKPLVKRSAGRLRQLLFRPGFPAFADRLGVTRDLNVLQTIDAFLERVRRIFRPRFHRFQER